MNARTLSIAIVLSLGLAAPPALGGSPISESADVHPQGEVEISNIAGRVEVTGWDQDRVEVTGTLGAGAERLEFRTQDRHTLIRVVHPSGARRVDASELRISMPQGGRVVVSTVAADVSIRGVSGAQRLQSVSGDVDTVVSGEDVQVKTVSGDLTLNGDGSPGLVTVTTVSGDAQLRGVTGELVLQTVSGDLEVEGGPLERVRMRTTNGSATLRSAPAPDARIEMEAVNGTLTLVLLGEPDAEFTLETFNGDIDNAFGPEPVRTSRFAPGTELRFTTGSGSARVNMETLNGSIILRTE
jgi:DUF4097 and DUF4098 domain-containing protein YvlB